MCTIHEFFKSEKRYARQQGYKFKFTDNLDTFKQHAYIEGDKSLKTNDMTTICRMGECFRLLGFIYVRTSNPIMDLRKACSVWDNDNRVVHCYIPHAYYIQQFG